MKTLVVTVTLDDNYCAAADFAVSLSNSIPVGKIILYHAYETMALTTDTATLGVVVPIAHSEQEDHVLAELESEVRTKVNPLTQVEVLTHDQALIDGIDEVCKDQDIDLILIGEPEEGANKWSSLFYSHSMAVIKSSSVPVLVVPPSHPQSIKNILLASDLKNVYETLPSEQIKQWVQDFGAKLYLVYHEAEPSERRNPNTVSQQFVLQRIFKEEDGQFFSPCGDNVVAGLKEFAIQHDVQLIMVVMQERGFFEGLFHSSVTRRLIRHSSIPIMVFKPKKKVGSQGRR